MDKKVNITQARKEIYNIASHVNEFHEEVTIYNSSTGNNIVILAEEDWNAIKETLYLMSIPGMTESIMEASKETIEDGVIYNEDEEW